MRAVRVTTGKQFEKATKMAALGLWGAHAGPPQEHQEPASDVGEDPKADPGLCKGPPHAPHHPHKAQYRQADTD